MKKIILAIAVFLMSIQAFSQLTETTYSIKSSNKTVIVPMFFYSSWGASMANYLCFTVKSFNNSDTLTITGSFTDGDSTGFDIALRKFSVDSINTTGIIYFNQLTAGKEYLFFPYVPTIRNLIFKANSSITDTIYVKTLFNK